MFNANGCEIAWNISGSAYRDDNSSCTLNLNEPGIQNLKLQLYQSGMMQQQVFSNSVGNYSFDTGLGSFQTRVDTTDIPFLVLCPVSNSYNSNLIASDSLDYNFNFGLQCNPGYDVAAQSTCQTSGLFFPAHLATVSIQAGDLVLYYGTTCNTAGLTGNVTATFTGPASIASVSANGLVAGNTVTWSVADFSQVSFFNDFKITFVTDTFAQVGDQICLNVTVTANTGTDNNLSNNTLTQCFNVVNSYDPNIKEVYPSTVSQAGGFHTYTVHFQNTGTAPAQHVQIIDTLDANFDWSSFQLLAYSHDNLTQVKPNGVVHFNFPNIQLPDSTSNEPGSHGYIQYKIRTKTDITPGTTIHNTASIYFDFNTPVVTNDAVVNYCVPVETQQSFSICDGDSVEVGSVVCHQAGTYTGVFTASSGCDSTVITTITVESIDAGVTQSDATLTATSVAASYQWINCNTNQIIAGATSPVYSPTESGSYAVQLSYGNGCAVTSSCADVIVTGVSSIHQGGLNVYPNPSEGTVRFDTEGMRGVLSVYDPSGKLIASAAVNGRNTAFSGLPAGLCAYRFVTESGALHRGLLTVQR